MNCREAEKYIYLYAELDPREREETDRHVANCAKCRQLLDAVGAQRNFIGAAFQVTPELADASRMTRSVMEAICKQQREKVSWPGFLMAIPSLQVLRYSMAVISFLLVVTFFSEYSAEHRTAPYKHIRVERNTKLNTASFHAAFIARKENEKTANSLLYECVVNCFYTPDGDCEGCRKKITNLN
jgi:anti-sigma factor RsiW